MIENVLLSCHPCWLLCALCMGFALNPCPIGYLCTLQNHAVGQIGTAILPLVCQCALLSASSKVPPRQPYLFH